MMAKFLAWFSTYGVQACLLFAITWVGGCCPEEIACGQSDTEQYQAGYSIEIRLPNETHDAVENDTERVFEDYLKTLRKCECGNCTMSVDWSDDIELEAVNGFGQPKLRVSAPNGGSVTWSCSEKTASLYSSACPAPADYPAAGSDPIVAEVFGPDGAAAFTVATVRRGDADGDGLVWSDWDNLVEHVWYGEDLDLICPEALDVNSDNTLDDADVEMLEAALLTGDLSRLGSAVCAPRPVSNACPFADHDQQLQCPEYFVRGDANADGQVDLTDALATLNHLFQNGADVCLEAADADASGQVDLSDAVTVLNHLFQGGPAPAAPSSFRGPSCRISCAFDYSGTRCEF